MKTKNKIGIAGIFALSGAALAMSVQLVPSQAVRAEGETETTVTRVVNCPNFWGSNSAAMFILGDGSKDYGYWHSGTSASTNPAPTYVNAFGEAITTNGTFPCGTNIIFHYGSVANYGNVVTFPKDMVITTSAQGSFKLSEETKFVCKLANGEGGDWSTYIEPTSVTVAEAAADIDVGKTYTIDATVTTTEENPLVFYKSSDATIAEVSADGVITAKAVGSATISVWSGLKHTDIAVTVQEGATLSSIALKDTAPVTLYQGDDWRMALKGLKGVKTYSDGSTIDFDITEEMCDASSYDAEKLGEQDVKITADGKETILKVNVLEIPELTIDENNLFGADQTGWGQYTFIAGSMTDIGQYVNLSSALVDSINEHILLNGEPFGITGVKQLGGARYIFYSGAKLKQGDVVTIKKGFRVYQYSGTSNGNHDANGDGYFTAKKELKNDYKYVVTNNPSEVKGTQFAAYEADPVGFELIVPTKEMFVNETAKIDWTIASPDGKTAYGTPIFSSSSENVATVDSNGNVIAKTIGKTTIKAVLKCGESNVEKSFELNVLAEKTRKGISFSDAMKVYSFVKGSDSSSFAPSFKKAKFIYEDDSLSAEFDVLASDSVIVGQVDTSVVGEVDVPVTFKRGEMVLAGSIKVNVYEYKEQKVKQVGIVDWFDYSTFIQCSGTGTNTVNLTDTEYGKAFMEKIKYYRADGTEVKLSTIYQLGTNIALFPSFLYDESGNKVVNADNYATLYQKGDTIKMAAKTPLYKWTGDVDDPGGKSAPVEGTGEWIVEGYFEEELIYRYGDAGWTRYIETTELVAKEETLTLEIGKNALANITRGPDGANSGTLTFSSSDATIAKVNEKTGVIQPLKPGTAKITGHWVSEDGKKTLDKVITVNVVDVLKSISGVSEITVDKGAELDLASLQLKLTYASGSVVDADASKVTVTGYDANTVGEQTVTISFTDGGKTVKMTVKVTVVEPKKAGCGGEIVGTSLVALTSAALVVGIAIKRKKEE